METNSSALIVPSVPATDTNVLGPLRDIKPPVDVPDYWMWFLISIGAFVLILIAVVIGLLIWAQLRKKLAPPPPPPPHVRARRRLQGAMAHINDPKRFVGEVSDAIRVYLEESFDLRAPERTTEEFLYELQSSNRLATNVKTSLNDFLSRCDLVKFAKYEPTQMELEELQSAAMRIVEETEPRPVTSGASPQPTTQK